MNKLYKVAYTTLLAAINGTIGYGVYRQLENMEGHTSWNTPSDVFYRTITAGAITGAFIGSTYAVENHLKLIKMTNK